MGWARFDDQYSDHPKVVRAGPMAELLDMRAVIYCARYETDGWLTREALARLAAGIPKVAQKAKALVDNGRWHAADHECSDCPEVFGDGFYVHDFLTYNPSSEAKDADRAAARDRMRKARESKRSPRSSGEQDPNERENNDRSSDNPVPDPSVNSISQQLHDANADAVENRRFEAVIDSRTRARLNGHPATPAHRLSIRRDLGRDDDHTRELLRDFPDAPAEAVAGHLDGEQSTLARYRRQEATA